MKSALVAVALAGCATSYQSARPVADGKTQVTVGLARTEVSDPNDVADSVWYGDLQLRHGLTERSDGGIRLTRVPGSGQTATMLAFDPKFLVNALESKTAVSISLPAALIWGEDGTDFHDGYVVLSPALLVGIEIAPAIELVLSPKLFLVFPDADIDRSEVEFGGSIGARFGDASRSWAVHPELGLLRATDMNDNSEVFLTFGLAVSAGN